MVNPCKFVIAGALAPAAVLAHSGHDVHDGLCGVKGHEKTKPKPYYTSTTPEDGEQGECTIRCASDDRCKSYAVGDGKCKLYEHDAVLNLIRNDKGPYTFYDRPCISHWATVSADLRQQQSKHLASASAQAEAMAKSASAKAAAFTGHDEL